MSSAKAMAVSMASASVPDVVDNRSFSNSMAPAWWHTDDRFKRLGESDGGRQARGGFGVVFIGFDALRQERVVIKRQAPDTSAAARETARRHAAAAALRASGLRVCLAARPSDPWSYDHEVMPP